MQDRADGSHHQRHRWTGTLGVAYLHILHTGENGQPLFPPIRFHPEQAQDDRLTDIRKAGTTTWSVHQVANDPLSIRIDICVEADASKHEALLAFLEVERPNENLRALVPVPLAPEEEEEEEEPEEEVKLVLFLGCEHSLGVQSMVDDCG